MLLNLLKTKLLVSFIATIATPLVLLNTNPTCVSLIWHHVQLFLILGCFITCSIKAHHLWQILKTTFLYITRNNSPKVQPTMTWTNKYKDTSLTLCINDWNVLPDNLVTQRNVEAYRSKCEIYVIGTIVSQPFLTVLISNIIIFLCVLSLFMSCLYYRSSSFVFFILS